ncbi:hypothetical protein KBZ21_43285, partial [Streptomyces sp. A73]|nr:hypothetical protein [Streptomyces sp. A73]
AMATFESQTINELFHQGEWPGKCHDVADLPNKQALSRLDDLGTIVGSLCHVATVRTATPNLLAKPSLLSRRAACR